ncbi:MAG: hypothetical protein ACYTDT_03140 [Planctomycetota bacterium]
MNDLKKASKGALVKLEPNDRAPWIDAAQVSTESPLVVDYFSVLLNRMGSLFPEQLPEFTAIQSARREGLETSELLHALWKSDESIETLTKTCKVNTRLTAAVLWLATKPLLEAVAEGFVQHFPIDGEHVNCPVCGGPAWAYHGKSARCSLCESVWQVSDEPRVRLFPGVQPIGAKRGIDGSTGRQVYLLDSGLFGSSRDPGVLMSVIQLL